ncbi:MAG: hypothetical protein VKJ05_04440 [Synechococcaceae cyanobacterium]|nr:hypothetical protein [Synechococcaceae cyanobacterium]
MLVSTPHRLPAADLSYRGLIELDHGSSLNGIPRYSRYFVDFVLNGDVLDTDHTVRENDFVNQLGQRGLTTYANFTNPFRHLRFRLDPSGPAAIELAELSFRYGQLYGDFARVVDVNQPPNPQNPPCDTSPCINEHITLEMRNTTPDSPIRAVWFNLYNSTFYNPIYADRQLLLDTSQPDREFHWQDLFLHGPQTLTGFLSTRTPDFSNLKDGVLLEGPNGTVASGRFLSLSVVPGPVPALGVAGLMAWSRRLRQRVRHSRGGSGPA